MNDFEKLDAEKDLYRIMDDPYAIEKRCVPAKHALEKVLSLAVEAGKHLNIRTMAPEDYKTLFAMMYSINETTALQDIKNNKIALSPHIPEDNHIQKTVEIFRFVAEQNQRGDSPLTIEDLSVLCWLYNYLLAKEDLNAYLERFKNWKG